MKSISAEDLASEAYYAEEFGDERRKPPRVEILRPSTGIHPYFQKGQFGYVVGVDTKGGRMFADKERPERSKPGEVAFLVNKKPRQAGLSLWFSAEALRFTNAPKDPLRELSDEERVVLDLFLLDDNGSHKSLIAELVPNAKRRGYLKTLATQVRSLRAR